MICSILIIEDEKPNVQRLQRLLQVVRPHATIVAVKESVADSVEWLSTHDTPDLIIMDIRLSDGLSFEIFEKIKVDSAVVFATAYDEYAVKAFKYNSVDYLLKPVAQEELNIALDKLDSYISQSNVNIENLLHYIQPREHRNRFLLPFRDGYKTLVVKDIAYIYSELKITRSRLYNGKEEILTQTLEELEQELNPKVFFRANRQFIVHIDAIDKVYNYFNGKLKLQIRNNPEVEIIISREKAALLKNWMDF